MAGLAREEHPLKTAGPKTIDEYLTKLSPEKRAALQRLRRAIHTAAPGADECISYRMPAFRYEGHMLLWFGASANHCALYPGGIVASLRDDLKGYHTSKGTIRFRPDRPLPLTLVRKIVKTCVARNRGRRSAR
jgi:uncharacterized protein YdhG (YjbR/CyaY superfamily)